MEHLRQLFSILREQQLFANVTLQDRLTTQDKLLKWGLKNSISCVFCRASVEDRNHLFFGCQFTAGIWKRILRFCGNIRHPRNWENEFLWVTATIYQKGLCGVLPYIICGDSGTVESMRTSLIRLMLFSI